MKKWNYINGKCTNLNPKISILGFKDKCPNLDPKQYISVEGGEKKKENGEIFLYIYIDLRRKEETYIRRKCGRNIEEEKINLCL